jgi:DNA invertase Pin-like site-specific DNA recombinase
MSDKLTAAQPTTVAYLRVSSRAQDHSTQRSAIERAAAARGDTITTWYSEKRSGKSLDRAELHRLRADARAGLVRKIYVFRVDRLTRSGIKDTLQVVEEFRAHRVELVSVSDGFAFDGPAAEIIIAVMSWAAKVERLAINERISAARDRLESEGRAWGRPSRFSAADIRRVVAMKTEGRTVREISMALKVPRSTVGRLLTSQKVQRKTTPDSPGP